MAVKIERLAAKGVFDPPTYTQAMKVTGGQSILLISGQVAYDDKGQPSHPGDFAAQARATYRALKAQVEAGGGERGHKNALHRPPNRSALTQFWPVG